MTINTRAQVIKGTYAGRSFSMRFATAISHNYREGLFSTPKVEFVCGECQRANQRQKSLHVMNGAAVGCDCKHCGETNLFPIRRSATGGLIYLTV